MSDLTARLKTTSGEMEWCHDVSRYASVKAEVQANSPKTFTTSILNGDGSGSMKIEREMGGSRVTIAEMKFREEDGPARLIVRLSGKGWILNDGAKVGERESGREPEQLSLDEMEAFSDG